MNKILKYILVGIGVFFLFTIVLAIVAPEPDTAITDTSPEESPASEPVAQEPTLTVEPVAYEIVKSEDISTKALGNKALSEYTLQEVEELPVAKRMSYHILVSPDIKENQVRPTVEKIVEDLVKEDDEVDSIHLLLYSDKEIVNGSYDVAMATWAPSGDVGDITAEIASSNDRSNYEINLQVKENLEEYLRTRGESEEKFGFTEEERKAIFKEIVAAERKSVEEADRQYPIETEGVETNIEKQREFQEQYMAEIRKKYDITTDIIDKISVEGVMDKWPMP